MFFPLDKKAKELNPNFLTIKTLIWSFLASRVVNFKEKLFLLRNSQSAEPSGFLSETQKSIKN